jgi:hypothetical protein
MVHGYLPDPFRIVYIKHTTMWVVSNWVFSYVELVNIVEVIGWKTLYWVLWLVWLLCL